MCRVDSQHYENISGTAACIVRVDNHLLAFRHSDSGKLFLPSAQPAEGEEAQCTAHRAAWQSAGFNVEVKQYLGSDEQQIRYYACHVQNGFGTEADELPAAPWAQPQIKSLAWVDPFIIEPNDWHRQDQLIRIRQLFNQSL